MCAFCLLAGCSTGADLSGADADIPASSPDVIETENHADTDANIDTDTAERAVPVLPTLPPIPALLEPTVTDSLTLEAENAVLLGGVRIENKMSDFTGTGYVTGFEQDHDAVEFVFSIETPGFYELNFISSSGNHGYKENRVYLNSELIGVVSVDTGLMRDSVAGSSVLSRVYMEKGQNTIKYEKYWGWVYLDALKITPSPALNPAMFDISPELVNPAASPAARRLMRFLTDIYGSFILTGQYSDNGNEVFVIKNLTGKTPAVLGLDLMDYTPSRVQRGTTSRAVERAISHHNLGGIVTICWHWNAPEDYLTGTWYRGFYTEHTNIELAKIMNGEDERGMEMLLRDIDAIAEPLKGLQAADVPVLWRPLHEASGGWFWWGAAGADAQIALWRLMYFRLTEHHGLNNLIWLWNGQAASWYPGDDVVDIIGEDIYAGEHVYASQIGKFMEAASYTAPPKMVVMSEIGTVFDPDLAVRDGAMWGFFAVWGGDFVLRGGLNRYSEQYTEEDMLLKMYNHERVLSLEDLPDWQAD